MQLAAWRVQKAGKSGGFCRHNPQFSSGCKWLRMLVGVVRHELGTARSERVAGSLSFT
jgi:hypothetical protein